MKHLALSFCVAGSILMLPGLASAQSNKQSGDAQTLQALLTEVRQLRLTLQKSNVIAYRSQITIERMRSARERVDLLTGELERIRVQVDVRKRALCFMLKHMFILKHRSSRDVRPLLSFNSSTIHPEITVLRRIVLSMSLLDTHLSWLLTLCLIRTKLAEPLKHLGDRLEPMELGNLSFPIRGWLAFSEGIERR